MLLAFHLTMMLLQADRQARGRRKVEYGIPFFDDLAPAAKIAVLRKLAFSLLDDEAEPLPDNVHTASALAALEYFVQESVRGELMTRRWSREKFGEETTAIRELIYRSRSIISESKFDKPCNARRPRSLTKCKKTRDGSDRRLPGTFSER
ncbi:MAG TPA: hypothetical protein DEB39_01420 [Planctomycetaceae bacterium]|nr:hypothetical protein [Planctomycetaceae bacterium]